jgi:glutaminyl-tRNA synthetase
MVTPEETIEEKKSLNFIEEAIESDIAAGKVANSPTQCVHTRFPPEPNGYLHIGHAKAICMDFGAAQKYGGKCNLRFDDTNPSKEDTEYVDAIKEDIHWLGFDWEDRCYYASDYFQQLWDLAEEMIRRGLAYVDELSAEEIAAQKGTPTQPGVESPYRNRPWEESLDLFRRMNKGEFEEGTKTLRAKIDMANPNMHFRDPIMYRIIKYPHHRTGTKWQAYPMYDFAHGQSDFFEGITHSICTLEFEVHRPLYEYFAKILADIKGTTYTPRQMEFNRLNMTYTMMSKRKLLALVKEGLVRGWNDPRMPTICGLRRRGYTPESIKNFIKSIGYTKYDGMININLLEHAVREDLNKKATRVMGVVDPVKVVLTNYPEDKVETVTMENNPEDPNGGVHEMPLSRELYIEREDFREEADKKFFRLTIDKEVRLKGAYIIKCTGVKKDAEGKITEILCTYDPETLSGMPGADRKVKGTLHWVSARHAVPVEVRIYNNLFTVEDPSSDERDFHELLNPESEVVLPEAYVEPYVKTVAEKGAKFQFQRIGYFCVDEDSQPEHLVFNRTALLRDSK